MIYLSSLLIAVLITIGTIPLLGRVAILNNVMDQPGGRKIHTIPIPRIGGIAMACGTLVPLLLWKYSDHFVVAFLSGVLLLVMFGLLDDLHDLSPKIKFLGQVLAGLVVIIGGGVQITSLGSLLPDTVSLPPMIAIPLTLVAIVGATNAINLADGLDGLAGGICLLIFSALGYLAFMESNQAIGIVVLVLIGALFGFLRFNTHPASIFMGDAGSQFLGFSAGTLSISLTQSSSTLSPVLPLILLGFPILDTLTVMTTRIAQKRSPFSADKNHFHHHLLELGLHHSESVLMIYIFQTLLIVASLLLRYYSDWFLLLSYFVFSAAVLFTFSQARLAGPQLRHFSLYNFRFVQWLSKLKMEGHLIKRLFPLFELGISLLLLVTCGLAGAAPDYVKFASLFFLLSIGILRFCAQKYLRTFLRATLYLLIPFAVYLSEIKPALVLNSRMQTTVTAIFAIFSVLILVISKFSRRQSGFKSSPLDFLIIILAVAIPNLPNLLNKDYKIGLVAAKVIMFYFSYEVLFSEHREKPNSFIFPTAAALLILAIK